LASILLADEEGQARAELARLLESAGYRVWQTNRGDESLAIARTEPLSLAILEIPLEVLSGYEVCRALKSELGPSFPVIFLSGSRTESYDRVAGLLVGADDYLVKPCAHDELLARIRLLEPRWRPTPPAQPRLTPREAEVLRLLVEGLTQQQIAMQLAISSKTVGTHIEHVLRKLGVNNRTQAVALALRGDGGLLHAYDGRAAATAQPASSDEAASGRRPSSTSGSGGSAGTSSGRPRASDVSARRP
jgi:DNA-binding NarL/FixJ family response regulator